MYLLSLLYNITRISCVIYISQNYQPAQTQIIVFSLELFQVILEPIYHALVYNMGLHY